MPKQYRPDSDRGWLVVASCIALLILASWVVNGQEIAYSQHRKFDFGTHMRGVRVGPDFSFQVAHMPSDGAVTESIPTQVVPFNVPHGMFTPTDINAARSSGHVPSYLSKGNDIDRFGADAGADYGYDNPQGGPQQSPPYQGPPQGGPPYQQYQGQPVGAQSFNPDQPPQGYPPQQRPPQQMPPQQRPPQQLPPQGYPPQHPPQQMAPKQETHQPYPPQRPPQQMPPQQRPPPSQPYPPPQHYPPQPYPPQQKPPQLHPPPQGYPPQPPQPRSPQPMPPQRPPEHRPPPHEIPKPMPPQPPKHIPPQPPKYAHDDDKDVYTQDYRPRPQPDRYVRPEDRPFDRPRSMPIHDEPKASVTVVIEKPKLDDDRRKPSFPMPKYDKEPRYDDDWYEREHARPYGDHYDGGDRSGWSYPQRDHGRGRQHDRDSHKDRGRDSHKDHDRDFRKDRDDHDFHDDRHKEAPRPPKHDECDMMPYQIAGRRYLITAKRASFPEAENICRQCAHTKLADITNLVVRNIDSSSVLGQDEWWVGSYDGGAYTPYLVLQSPSVTVRPNDATPRRVLCDA